jgi:hypothetical protein
MEVPWGKGEESHEMKRTYGKKPDSLVFVPPNFYRFVKSAMVKSARMRARPGHSPFRKTSKAA